MLDKCHRVFAYIFPWKVLGPGDDKHNDSYNFTVLFTKPPDCMLLDRMLCRDHSCHWLPFTANGNFSVPQELYQAKAGSHEAGGFMNSSVKVYCPFCTLLHFSSIAILSMIYKAGRWPAACRNALQRPFSHSGLKGFFPFHRNCTRQRW